MEKRQVIKNGYRWMRFIFIPVFLLAIIDLIISGENLFGNVIVILICAMLYFLFSISRRLKYDSQNFYIIRGIKERVIPFSSIISIKKSRAKVNGSRYWILLYKDEFGSEHKCRYFLSFFYKDFNESVKRVNPDVVIWTHPFFNH